MIDIEKAKSMNGRQVAITLGGGRVEAFAGKETTKPTVTTSAVALAEPPQTFVNPIRLELEALYDQINRLPAGHPGHRLKMERWKSLEHKLLGRSAP